MFSQLSGPLGQQLTLVLLHFLWQGAVVAALLAVPLSFLRSARQRYLATLLALFVMAVLPAATFCIVKAPSGAAAAMVGLSRTNAASDPDRISDDGQYAPESFAGGLSRAETLSPWGLAHWALWVQPYVLTGWLAGVLVFNLRLLSAWLGTLWLRGGSAALPRELSARIASLGKHMGLAARDYVFASARVQQAIAVGLWRPVVLMPLAWLSELPPEVLEAVIAHELAHIRRHDLWVTWLQRLLESVLFFHPAVWWISRQLELAREMCCDELAVRTTGRAVAYARALETVGRRLAANETCLLATSFRGETNMNLLARVRLVLGHRPQPEQGTAWLAGLVLLAVFAGFGLLAGTSGGATQTEESKDERPSAEAEGKQSAAAEEAGRRSPEAEADARRSAESEAGPRRSAEAEAGTRRSAEAEAGSRRSAEAEREGRRRPQRDDGDRQADALRDFEPQNDREAALVGVIRDLQEQLNDLRREVRALRGGDRPRDGEGRRRAGPRDGEGPRKPGPRDGEGPRRIGPRDGEGPPKPGPRDGEGPRKPGPRDGEGPRKIGPRDGEGPSKPGPRDGEAPKPAQGDT